MTTDVFQEAADRIYESELAVDAKYQRKGSVKRDDVRVIPARADQMVDFGDAELVSASGLFKIRRSQVAQPCEGDLLRVDGEWRRVQGDPTLNRRRIEWLLDTAPCEAG